MNKSDKIAYNNLHDCFKDGGITASIDHFQDFWARDSFFASWGLLELGEFERVKSNLKLFIKYQNQDGQIPRRIDRFFVALNYLGVKVKRKSLKPKYKGAYFYLALDPNILFIITCHKYIKKTNDIIFLQKNFDSIFMAIQWVEKYESGLTLHEGIFANWMDVVIKTGAVLYTNVLYAEALKNFSEISILLSKTDIAETYSKKYRKLKEEINNKFWNGTYYIDWINKRKKYNYFSSDGNVLAMLFKISNQEQNKQIINHIERFKLDNIPLKTNHPSYPWWRIAFRMYVVGMPGYQNNFASWLWLGCIYTVALHENGYKEKADRVYGKIFSKIGEYSMVYEIYKPNGSPYRGWFFGSAISFAWSSGLFLWMKKALNK